MRSALVVLFTALAWAPMAANWPQWRGPSGLGVSAESGLPATWSARENVAWRVALRGLGTSSPIVWGHRVGSGHRDLRQGRPDGNGGSACNVIGVACHAQKGRPIPLLAPDAIDT